MMHGQQNVILGKLHIQQQALFYVVIYSLRMA